ncbi:serine/threonine-protein kinase ATM [Chironomus tepperi]|uniref:serine/threonine-protein kinase ATM n=1 Tax=Chironomus tepperi TaxID=113505 RepID=UPI00391F67D2
MINTDEIEDLKRELRTDKKQNRQKAFVKLSSLLSNQRNQVNAAFENNERNDELSYNALFYCAHEGIKLQALSLGDTDINEADNRIKVYSIGMFDLLQASNDSSCPPEAVIQNTQLIQAVIEVLRNGLLLRHFGNTYLEMLRTILNTSTDFTDIQCEDWKVILKMLFKIMKANSLKFQFLFLIDCAQRVTIAGCENSYLALEMINLKVFEHLKTIIATRNSGTNYVKERQELLVLLYYCCRDNIIDFRFEICRYLEEFTAHIQSAFLSDTHDRYRPTLIKLMNLALIAHIPILGNDKDQMEYIHDKKNWYDAIKQYEYLLLEELKPMRAAYREKTPPKVSSITCEFAARFCFYAYWNDEILKDQDSEDSGIQVSKRMKLTKKLQTIIDRIRPSVDRPGIFNWKWLAVLCELISNYPETLQNDDIADILSLLSECQPLIEFKEQIYSFTKCCSIILQHEENFKNTANKIVYTRCQALWSKISDEAARCCSNSNKNLIESHKLLQLLIYYHKYSSPAFIESVVKIFTSNSTIKCDTTLNTLIVLLKSFNLDSLQNGKEHAKEILRFTFEKITLAVLKKVIAGNDKPSYPVLAHLAILCSLLKTDVINYFKNVKIDPCDFYDKIIDLDEQKVYKAEVESIINLMQLKMRGKLIIENENFLKQPEKVTTENNLEVPTELKCMVDEDIFCELMKLTELGEKVISENSSTIEIKDYLKDVMSSNELMMNLLSELLKLEATNQKKMESLFITKRILLYMQEIERIFTIISTRNIEFDTADTNKIALQINALLSSHYHSAVGKLIRKYDLKSCLKWVCKQVEREFYDTEEYPNLKLNLKAFVNAKFEHKMRYLMITTLCEYFNYEGINTDIVVEWIDRIQFSIENNIDLHTIFKVIDIFGRQKNIPEVAALWIWGAGIVFIFKNHRSNLYIMNCLIDRLFELKQFSYPYDQLATYYVKVFTSFSKLCSFDANSNRCFGPKIVSKFLSQFKHFHDAYFTLCYDQPVVKIMYEKVYKECLCSDSFEVRMAAIECFSTILFSEHDDINPINEQKMMNACRKSFFKDFLAEYEFVYKENYENHNDEDVNNLSTYVQLFTALFFVNFNFRRSNLFELAKIFINFNLTENDGLAIFQKVLKQLKCSSSKSVISTNDIVDLLSKWVEMSLEMNRFPWHLTGSSSYQDFINEHYNLILLAALKTKCEVVDDFIASIEVPLKDAVVPIMSNCLAFLIPHRAKCVIKYEANTNEMSQKLSTAFTENEQNMLLLEHLPNVIVHMLENVIDNQKFLEMTGYQMDFTASFESIKFSDFEKCMQYIQHVYKIKTDQNLVTYLSKNRFSYVEQLFMFQKKNIQGTESKEQKILSLLHYNIIVRESLDYMKDQSVQNENCIKEYLSREVANFYCYLIINTTFGEKLRIIAADFLLYYLHEIIPVCSNHFKSQLQKIIPQLVTICKTLNPKTDSHNLKSKCMEIMNFLVLNQPTLNDEIARLDRFPLSNEFNELRAKQLNIKYGDEDFALIEEIEHFLELKNRRIEGLTALYEHLASKNSDLKYLFEELRTMIGDKANSTLHRLIRSLVGYIRGKDEERAVEAVKCLGQIGCHNISTIIFDVEDKNNESTYVTFSNVLNCQRLICNQVLEKLELLLIHHNVNIFQVASEACYYLLRSASSIDFIPSPYFSPFLTEDRSNENLFYLEPKSDKVLDLYSFVAENNFIEYSRFMKGFCVNMNTFAGDKMLINLIQMQLEFAETLFPLIFHLLLLYNNEAANTEILKTLSYYFEQCFEQLNYSEHTNEGSIFINKKIIRQMLKLVEKIRIYCQDHPSSKMAIKQDLNFLHIAKAAKHCEALFTAIQYCEMWARKRLEANDVAFSTSIKDKTLQDIMYRSYSAIGIREASDIFLNPITNRSEYLKNNGLYLQSLLEISKDAPCEDYMKLLNDIGLHHISNKFNENMNNSKNVQQYECLWKLSKWNTIVETDSEIKDDKGLIDYQEEFEKYHYLSLQYSSNIDEVGMRNAVFKSRKMIMQLITHHILECSNSLYKFLEMSQRLAQIEDFSEVLFKRSTNELLLKKWKTHEELPFDYEHCSKVFLQRNSILSTANIRAGKRTWVPDAVQYNSLFLVKNAVLVGQQNDAITLITELKESVSSIPKKLEVLLEEAKLNMNRNEKLAKTCLTEIINTHIKEEDAILLSTAHRLFGEILAENFSVDLSIITKNHFDISMSFLDSYARHYGKHYLVAKLDDDAEFNTFSQSLNEEKDDDDKSRAIESKIQDASCIYDTIARYNDREYEFKLSYITSPDFVQKKLTYTKNAERMKAMKVNYTKNADADFKKSYAILSKSTELDRIEIENAEKEKKLAARNAIYYYVRSTIYSPDDNILNIFRIISLMLANFSKSSFIKGFLEKNLLKIPSYKFIITLPQLTVRLNDNKSDPLNKLLKALLTRCALDHPHHTLPLILALVNSYADSNNDNETEEPRVVGAKDLWKSLKQHEAIKPIMIEMEKMSSALINLANLPLKTSSIPTDHNVLKLTNLKYAHCPTMDLPVMKNANYKKTLITVQKWDQNVKSVGGINAPKRIEVLCSDGIKRPQLLKGKDDMRQDAIMQQIFGVVNKLLLLDKNMQKNNARIRTYKVVPFSRRSGILEWCANTTPIGCYLAGERGSDGRVINKGAHEIYRPNDWSPALCMRKISEIPANADSEDKLEKFNEILSHIKPVFHNFFYEKFKNPGQHFEKRFAYTISVAVSSMIGYILGIGDRHVQNILIDLKTAELIHIDFGVAFEQGKILPHPELIPFRLTRDIVAPFGVSGVDGIFRKACENTIKILRKNDKALTTILEVLLYDPMYMWTFGVDQARRSQLECESDDHLSGEKVEHDLMASRALNCVKMKLKGMAENTSVRYPSIEGQVQYLIQAATNPSYLSKLFRGWQAYL